MAITINSTPDNFEPVYTNSMPFVVSSGFQAEENFKYLFNLYNADTLALLTTVAPYPRPNTTGIYSPHYVLQSLCDTQLRATSSVIFSNSTARARYYLTFGENYNPGLTFGDTYLIGSYVGNFLGLEFATNISTELFIGDQIIIEKNNISINPWIQGQATILSITNSTLAGYSKTVFTDIPLQSPVFSSNESGSITNVVRYTATSSTLVGVNAARQYDDFSDFSTDYVSDGVNSFFKFCLSAYPDFQVNSFAPLSVSKKPIYSNEYETIDINITANNFTARPDLRAVYTYYNSTGAVLGTDARTFSSVPVNTIRYTIPVGTANIISFGGSGSTFLNNGQLSFYDVEIENSDGTNFGKLARTLWYKIKEDCRPYEIIRLAFLNKLGGYDYWSFNLVSKYTSQVKRTQIDRALSPTYVVGDRGRDVIYSEAVENWTINSDFLTDDEALFIRELVESPSVFLIDGINQLPVVITSDSYEYKSGLLNGYVQYTLTFQKSYDVIINR